MGYGELEANDINKPSSQSLPRKTISLKLKRESLEAPVREDEYESPKKKERQEEMRPQEEELNWNFKVKLAAEKKTNILNMCEKCKKPILVHGRLIPCKHFLCLSCAQGGTRTCFKCNKEIIGIQPVPTIYVCTSDGTRHSVTGCRKSYLNLRGLAQHQTLRYSAESALFSTHHSSGVRLVEGLIVHFKHDKTMIGMVILALVNIIIRLVDFTRIKTLSSLSYGLVV